MAGKKDKHEEKVSHTDDALPISMMPGSPGLYFAHQNSLFLSGLVFMCQQDTVCFQCYGRECNNQRELGQVIYKKESPFTRKALFMKFQE